MREAIHPEYQKVTAVCVCGNTIETGSTMREIRLDVCSGCHPFYTGTQKIMDTEGRVEKFKKRYAGAEGAAPAGKAAKGAKASLKTQAAPETKITEEGPENQVKTYFTLENGTKVEVESEVNLKGEATLKGKPETKIAQSDSKIEVKTWFNLSNGMTIEVEGELKTLAADAEAGEVRTENEGGEVEVKRVYAVGDMKLEVETEIKVKGKNTATLKPEPRIEAKDKKLELKIDFELEDGTSVNVESEVKFLG